MYNKKSNKQFIRRGIERLPNGNYKAKTYLKQRIFSSFADAIQWLKFYGFNVFGQRPGVIK